MGKKYTSYPPYKYFIKLGLACVAAALAVAVFNFIIWKVYIYIARLTARQSGNPAVEIPASDSGMDSRLCIIQKERKKINRIHDALPVFLIYVAQNIGIFDG